MGIPVLLNPFGAERLTRQRLLNAVQQTDNYIMSQQVLYNDSLNTCNQDTVCSQWRMPHACYMFVKTLLQVVETRHCYTEVTPYKNGPLEWLGKCLLNRSHPNWIRWYQAETYRKEDMRVTWYGNHCAIQKTVQGYWKWQKVANNGLVGGRFQGGLMLIAT